MNRKVYYCTVAPRMIWYAYLHMCLTDLGISFSVKNTHVFNVRQ